MSSRRLGPPELEVHPAKEQQRSGVEPRTCTRSRAVLVEALRKGVDIDIENIDIDFEYRYRYRCRCRCGYRYGHVDM